MRFFGALGIVFAVASTPTIAANAEAADAGVSIVPKTARTQWEYKMLVGIMVKGEWRVPTSRGPGGSLNEAANDMGREGWEMVNGMVTWGQVDSGRGSQLRMFFKRSL